MLNKTGLGDRMKEYEYVSRIHLMRRNPVIIRIDGKSFHNFTKRFDRPYDEVLSKTMQGTMKYLCENIQGCVMGYTQSDEISLVLCDYKKLTTSAWFDNNIQKMCSISASMATMQFNRLFDENYNNDNNEVVGLLSAALDRGEDPLLEGSEYTRRQMLNSEYLTVNRTAMFDSRVYSIPREEVCNYFLWRQQDASRNSIQMLGQSKFSHKQLHGKNCNQIQDMLITEYNINWNNVPTRFKRGSTCVKESYNVNVPGTDGELCTRTRWIIDNEIPVFSADKEYINKRITFDVER